MGTAEKLDNVFNNLFRPQSNEKKANNHHDTILRNSLIMPELYADIKFVYTSLTNIQI